MLPRSAALSLTLSLSPTAPTHPPPAASAPHGCHAGLHLRPLQAHGLRAGDGLLRGRQDQPSGPVHPHGGGAKEGGDATSVSVAASVVDMDIDMNMTVISPCCPPLCLCHCLCLTVSAFMSVDVSVSVYVSVSVFQSVIGRGSHLRRRADERLVGTRHPEVGVRTPGKQAAAGG